MPVALSPQQYFVVDWGSKLVGIVAIVAGLEHLFGSLSIPVAVVGLIVGIVTVFVDVDGDE
jgi:type IV secretory pathway VirB2 component (pilin)